MLSGYVSVNWNELNLFFIFKSIVNIIGKSCESRSLLNLNYKPKVRHVSQMSPHFLGESPWDGADFIPVISLKSVNRAIATIEQVCPRGYDLRGIVLE